MREKSWDEFWEVYKEPSTSEKWLIQERNKVLDQKKKIFFGGSKIKILEVGCGYASNSSLLNKKRDYEVFCIDSSKEVISKVKRRIKNAFVMDARATKFKENSFDMIFSAGLLEHFKDPSGIIKEMMRIVKKGGLIITFVPGKYSIWQLWIKIHGKKWQHGYEEPYTKAKLNRIFEGNGAKIIYNGGIDPFSINGVLLKLFNFKTSMKKSFPSAYTEIYSVVKKL